MLDASARKHVGIRLGQIGPDCRSALLFDQGDGGRQTPLLVGNDAARSTIWHHCLLCRSRGFYLPDVAGQACDRCARSRARALRCQPRALPLGGEDDPIKAPETRIRSRVARLRCANRSLSLHPASVLCVLHPVLARMRRRDVASSHAGFSGCIQRDQCSCRLSRRAFVRDIALRRGVYELSQDGRDALAKARSGGAVIHDGAERTCSQSSALQKRKRTHLLVRSWYQLSIRK